MKESKQYGMVVAVLATVTGLILFLNSLAFKVRNQSAQEQQFNTYQRVTTEQFWQSIPS